jgi:hypothetical protein
MTTTATKYYAVRNYLKANRDHAGPVRRVSRAFL